MISIKGSVWACLLLAFSAVSFALSQEDGTAIEKNIIESVKAWNERRMGDFSKAYSSEASFINVFGELFIGRSAIENRHLKMHENKNSNLEIKEINLREIQKGVVIAVIKWQVTKSGILVPIDSSSDTREGIWTQVFVKEGDQWLINAAHNTFVTSENK